MNEYEKTIRSLGGIEINYLSKCDKEIFHDKQLFIKV